MYARLAREYGWTREYIDHELTTEQIDMYLAIAAHAEYDRAQLHGALTARAITPLLGRAL